MEILQNTGAFRPPKANNKNPNQEASNSGYNNLLNCIVRIYLITFSFNL